MKVKSVIESDRRLKGIARINLDGFGFVPEILIDLDEEKFEP